MDAALVANVVINLRKRSSNVGLVCKLDIEKVYDHVNWKFLLLVLEKMGFGPKWHQWIFFFFFYYENGGLSQWYTGFLLDT